MTKNKTMDDVTLLIPDYIVNDTNCSNYSLAVYCTLQALSIPTQLPIQCVTIHQLIYYLTGLESQQRNHLYDYIKCGLNELIATNTISKISEFQKHYILDCSSLRIDTKKENFSVVTFKEVQKIFKTQNTNNFLLLKYFILLMGTLYNKVTVQLDNGDSKHRVVGNMTIEYLSKLSGLSERSIIEYNKTLEEIGLVYICRQDDFVIEDGVLKKLPNVYGRMENKDYINQFAVDQKNNLQSFNYVNSNTNKANQKRQLAQMYLQLSKGNGEKYSEDDVISIHSYVISENEKYKRLYEKTKQESYLEKIRDVSVFDKYDFL